MIANVTVTVDVAGLVDDVGTPGYTVTPGTYDVEQVDDGEVWIVVDAVPDVCVVIKAADIGLVDCPACGGRGEVGYRVSVDEWETDDCGCCDGDGIVAPHAAAATEAMMEQSRREMYP